MADLDGKLEQGRETGFERRIAIDLAVYVADDTAEPCETSLADQALALILPNTTHSKAKPSSVIVICAAGCCLRWHRTRIGPAKLLYPRASCGFWGTTAGPDAEEFPEAAAKDGQNGTAFAGDEAAHARATNTSNVDDTTSSYSPLFNYRNVLHSFDDHMPFVFWCTTITWLCSWCSHTKRDGS